MIDISKPLYDSAGYQHSLVSATQSQIVTRTHGIFGVSNRKTGECLIGNSGDIKLSNNQLAPKDVHAERVRAAEVFAGWHAVVHNDQAHERRGESQ